MRLGLSLGDWDQSHDSAADLALAREAERLGYAVVWVGEKYGSEATSFLRRLADETRAIDLGWRASAIPPGDVGVIATDLDAACGGRLRVCVDVPSTAPVAIPLYVAGVDPGEIALAGRTADGWLSALFAPEGAEEAMAALDEALAIAGRDRTGFDISPTVPLVVGDDRLRAADAVRAQIARYIAGTGAGEDNPYYDHVAELGYEQQADVVRHVYLQGLRDSAAAGVPYDLIAVTSLLGRSAQLAERMTAYAHVGVTTLVVSCPPAPLEPQLDALRTAADALDLSGMSD
jgi:alkanesulfonate monooxygenase SsuD/methylene tetrahydromethanopterin reductase-like flavin-dependent oxidoreductase (luciferase family)